MFCRLYEHLNKLKVLIEDLFNVNASKSILKESWEGEGRSIKMFVMKLKPQ